MRRLKQPAGGFSGGSHASWQRWKLPAGAVAMLLIVLLLFMVKQVRVKQSQGDLKALYKQPRLVELNLGEKLAVGDFVNEGQALEQAKSWKERLRESGVAGMRSLGFQTAHNVVPARPHASRERSGKRGRVWTVACLSETQGRHSRMKVPDGDVLILAGGFTKNGTADELRDVNEWLGDLPHRYKVLVPSMVDIGSPPHPQPWLREALSNANAVLVDSSFVLPGGVIIFGSLAANLREGSSKWDLIPHNIDILVTQGQPHQRQDLGTLDDVMGSAEAARAIEKARPRLVVLGHVQHATKVLRQTFCRKRGWLRSCHEALEELPASAGPLRIEQPVEESELGAMYLIDPSLDESNQRPPLLIELEEQEGPSSAGLAAWVKARGQGPGWTNLIHRK